MSLNWPKSLYGVTPRLTSGRPNGGGSPSQDGSSLRSNSNLVEAEGVFSGLHLRPWVFLRMVQAEAVEYRKRGWSNRGGACRGHCRRPEHGLECFICQPCLVDPPGCCVPGLRIGVGRSSKRHGGDLTLDIQFESVAEFDYQGPEVRVSGI